MIFQELLDKYAFLAYEKQNRLSAIIGEHEWILDIDKAQVTFNNTLHFDVYFLGTESSINNGWLWADANPEMEFPSQSLSLCHEARIAGRRFGIDEFNLDRFTFLEEVGKPTADTLAMVGVCLVNGSCYYRGSYENGAVYFILSDSRIDSQPDLDLNHLREAFNNLMWICGDTKKRLISYLYEKGYIAGDVVSNEFSCRLYTGERIAFSFKPTIEGGLEITFSS